MKNRRKEKIGGGKTIMRFFILGVLILFPLVLYSLTMTYALEVGYLPMHDFNVYESKFWNEHAVNDCDFYIDMETSILFKCLYLEGEVKTFMWKSSSNHTFAPHKAVYRFGGGFKFSNITIGFSHHCTHPIVPYIVQASAKPIWEGAYEEIFIRFSGSTGK